MAEINSHSVFEELQHLQCLGLTCNPFPVAPDNRNFFISERIDRVTVNIIHGIVARKGFLVLTGDIGLGKTTISRRIIDILEEKQVATSLVLHSTYQDVELLREINRDFGLQVDSLNFSNQMQVLNRFLLKVSRQGKNAAIIIDDAQNLSRRSLELVRMISNLEADRQKLVQILLVGQPELLDQLNTNALRQLKSRITINETVRPLSIDELKYYLLFKLNAVGNSGRVKISQWALRRIHRITGGNLRKVNILMDRCLYAVFLLNADGINRRVVNIAHNDLNGHHRRFRLPRRALAVAAGITSIGLLIAGLQYYSPNRPVDVTPRVVYRKIIGPPTGGAAPLQNAESAATDRGIHSIDGPHSLVSVKSVSRFLAAHRLTAYTRDLTAALRQGRLHHLAAKMVDKTGYELVSLRQLPDGVKGRYDILRYLENPGGIERYLLIWRPPLKLTRFFDAYQGTEIARLQKMLARRQLYSAGTDGIVRPGLKSALSRFQRQMELPDTGYPDGTTMFLLYYQDGIDQG